MSTPNFFSVLGEDSGPAVGAGAVHLDHTPKVAESKSSKKADSNPKADPAKARKKAPAAPSNDRILKENKDGGRSGNRKVPVQEGASQHRSRRAERTDRMPRSNVRDTPKRTRAGWGGEDQEPKEEALGEEIAHKDEAADAVEDEEPLATEPEAPKLTLEQYLQQQREIADSLNLRNKKSSATPAASQQPAATEAKRAETQAPEPRKKLSNKPRKENQVLEIDTTQAPPLVKSDRPERGERRAEGKPRSSGPRGDAPARGGKPSGGARSSARGGARGGKPSGGKPSGKPTGGKANGSKPAFDFASLPKLN